MLIPFIHVFVYPVIWFVFHLGSQLQVILRLLTWALSSPCSHSSQGSSRLQVSVSTGRAAPHCEHCTLCFTPSPLTHRRYIRARHLFLVSYLTSRQRSHWHWKNQCCLSCACLVLVSIQHGVDVADGGGLPAPSSRSAITLSSWPRNTTVQLGAHEWSTCTLKEW